MAKSPKALDIQLFVLLHAPSIVFLPPYRNAYMLAAFIGRRNVSSTVKTLRKRKWIAYAKPFAERNKVGPLFAASPEGRNILWNACCEALEA